MAGLIQKFLDSLTEEEKEQLRKEMKELDPDFDGNLKPKSMLERWEEEKGLGKICNVVEEDEINPLYEGKGENE